MIALVDGEQTHPQRYLAGDVEPLGHGLEHGASTSCSATEIGDSATEIGDKSTATSPGASTT
ncbi:hypothetical protein BJF84_27100 [Rhodococcus sp. CUA-806]|nr:hypothetical protein BJF84_27100 [Rhodococcus sp. CUA-806]